MKPLTIEELKALKEDDWVWVIDKDFDLNYYANITKQGIDHIVVWGCSYDEYDLLYSDYGTMWLAYKNKEQAESKGEFVELPFINPLNTKIPIWEVIYRNSYGSIVCETHYDKEEAEEHLKELKELRDK